MLGGFLVAFAPLIEIIISPASEDVAREGGDMRPMLMIVTIPVGVVIVVTGIGIGAWESRRRR